MTLDDFESLRALHDHQVRLTFNEGHVVIATLISATRDTDETATSFMTRFG